MKTTRFITISMLRLKILLKRAIGLNISKDEELLKVYTTDNVKNELTSLFLADCGLRIAKENEDDTEDSQLNEEQLRWKKCVSQFGYKVKILD